MQQWHDLETLKGYSLQARDGEIGTITDVWFDDERWTVRYLVVCTGGWLLWREVLLAPSVVRGLNPGREQIAVDLTWAQVETSPPVDSEQPVSRHYETQLHHHYGWTPRRRTTVRRRSTSCTKWICTSITVSRSSTTRARSRDDRVRRDARYLRDW